MIRRQKKRVKRNVRVSRGSHLWVLGFYSKCVGNPLNDVMVCALEDQECGQVGYDMT